MSDVVRVRDKNLISLNYLVKTGNAEFYNTVLFKQLLHNATFITKCDQTLSKVFSDNGFGGGGGCCGR